MSRLSPCSTEGSSKHLLWTQWRGKLAWSGTRNATVIMEITKAPHASYSNRDYQVISRLPGHSMVAMRAKDLDEAKAKADELFEMWLSGMALKIVE